REWAVCGLAAVCGCFDPVFDHPRCGPHDECPARMSCNMQSGVCEIERPVAADASIGDGIALVDGATLDGTVAPLCLGGFVRVCVDPPQASVTLNSQTIDTSLSPQCRPYTATPAVDACVIAGQSIAVPANDTVSVVGGRPLVLLSSGAITITGVLDA